MQRGFVCTTICAHFAIGNSFQDTNDNLMSRSLAIDILLVLLLEKSTYFWGMFAIWCVHATTSIHYNDCNESSLRMDHVHTLFHGTRITWMVWFGSSCIIFGHEFCAQKNPLKRIEFVNLVLSCFSSYKNCIQHDSCIILHDCNKPETKIRRNQKEYKHVSSNSILFINSPMKT